MIIIPQAFFKSNRHTLIIRSFLIHALDLLNLGQYLPLLPSLKPFNTLSSFDLRTFFFSVF